MRRVIRSGERVTDTDVRDIIDRVRSAPFSTRSVSVDPDYARIAAANGFTVHSPTDALTAHVAKHVWAQQQWMVTTTPEEYLDDIRTVIGARTARLAFYERGRRPVVAVVAETDEVVPVGRIGPASGPYVLVMYSPDSAMILTAYMIRSIEAANIPAGALWLK